MQSISPSNLNPGYYTHRFYRDLSQPKGGFTFQVREKESDLWIHTDARREGTARQALLKARRMLNDYMERDPKFKTSLSPIHPIRPCPRPIYGMIRAAKTARVGPMAGVAGMIAQYVGKALISDGASHVIVENGGDLFIYRPKSSTKVGLFAGQSPLSLKIGINIPPSHDPIGVATSSATVGPSLSFGRADAVCAISPDATLADAVVTSIANRIQTPEDMKTALSWGSTIEGIVGISAILGSNLAAWGAVELVKL